MAILMGEKLVEYVIRMGTQDVMENPKLLKFMIYADKQENQGAVFSGGDPDNPEREPLVMDEFQKRLKNLPRLPGEAKVDDLFMNTFSPLADIEKYLSEANIKIIQGFPRSPSDLPCISINLGGDDEKQFLGGFKDEIKTDDKTYLLVGSDWRTQYFINVTTTNYEETLIWQMIIKFALTVYRPHLEAYGLRNSSMSWMDVDIAQELSAGGVFAYQRSCSLSCERDESYPVTKDGYSALAFQNNGTIDDITP